jgi:hypothetical protein
MGAVDNPSSRPAEAAAQIHHGWCWVRPAVLKDSRALVSFPLRAGQARPMAEREPLECSWKAPQGLSLLLGAVPRSATPGLDAQLRRPHQSQPQPG